MVEFSHIPVLLDAAMDGLCIKPDGIYVDGTLGGGGFCAQILARLHTGWVVGIDRDASAIEATLQNIGYHSNFLAVHDNFFNLPDILEGLGLGKINGMVLDLGVSSHQIDTPDRGFSFTKDGPLDMRMDVRSPATAADIVNTLPEIRLARILYTYGEEKKSRRIARAICEARTKKSIDTTGHLSAIIMQALGINYDMNVAARSFMALRIFINNELDGLSAAIRAAAERLLPRGRLVIITFHSLEDRIVKHTFGSMAGVCTCPHRSPVCLCPPATHRVLTRRPITPTAEEIAQNPRAKSAKMRILEAI